MGKYSSEINKQYFKQLEEKGGQDIEIFSNFAHLDNSTKILVLDSIIDHAKDVFGPYSGVYGEVILDYNNVAEGEFVADNCQYVKTSDGASFFSRINFGNRYGVTILKSIQQQTKYLSGFSDNTSRDGTTSLAMIGALTAKNFLIYEDMNKSDIPKNIRALVKDIIGYSATSMMKDDIIKIYDADNMKYVNEDGIDGQKWALNAINTTVGNAPGFVDAFDRVMNIAVNSKFDLTSAYMMKPERKIGNYKLDIEIEAGVKMKASGLQDTKVEGFKDNYAHMFIVEGYISDHNAKVFKTIFREWVKQICMAKDENGLLRYSKYNRNFKGLPVFIVNRVSEAVKDMYKELALEGFSFNMNINGQNVKETIRPIIMLGHDIDVGKTYYQDCKDIFSEIIVDINAINRMCNKCRLQPLEYNEKGLIEPTSLNQNDLMKIAAMFPFIEENLIKIDRAEYTWSDDEMDKVIGDPVPYTYSQDKFLLRTSYNGSTFLMNSEDREIVERMKLKRESLLNMKNSLDDSVSDDYNLEARIDYMSGVSFKPVIYCRTDDDYHNLVNLLDDALGVFQSTHVHGIMPGANTWILKRIKDLRDRLDYDANITIRKVVKNEDLVKKYVNYAKDCLEMIYSAYCLAYNYIDREDAEARINHYADVNSEFRDVYNVITGVFDDTILEAARTTSDVFIGSLYIGFDIVDLKRIRVTNYNEWRDVYNRNKENNYHKSNKGEDNNGK